GIPQIFAGQAAEGVGSIEARFGRALAGGDVIHLLQREEGDQHHADQTNKNQQQQDGVHLLRHDSFLLSGACGRCFILRP
ncbi:MAG: hypothetical protein ACK56I_02090, partial [bacterium]